MEPTKKIFRYRHLVEEIEHKILNGTYHPGERLPSIRKLHKQSNLSISTIMPTWNWNPWGLLKPGPNPAIASTLLPSKT
ncbi:MAG: GntR family transcriptional regulator [Desulfobacterales bacterium]|jgi:hypothetical protein